jgi:hypothetical protein
MTGSLRLAAMLNARMRPTSGNSRKNRSGLKPEHTAALVENGLGKLAQKEFDTRIGITPKTDTEGDISFLDPVVPTIGEFADHDSQQGAAIDYSIATGEGLFA